jgi:hypothetical protein
MVGYPVKVLLAFGESFVQPKAFTATLSAAGYPELSALSGAIRGSEEALQWLLGNNFTHLAALDAAIDNDEKAQKWLEKYQYTVMLYFARACNRDTNAANWLKENDLDIFLHLAEKINYFRDNQYFNIYRRKF